MEQLTNQVIEWLALYGLKLVGAVATLILGLIAAKMLRNLFVKGLERAKVDETLVVFFGDIMRFVLIAMVLIAALNQMGVQTASLIAILAAASLAVGLALQNQLSSLAAGVLLLITRPFKIGDMVEVGGSTGAVERISILSTRLKGYNGTIITMPNGQIWGNKIINYHETPTRRIELIIGIGYEDDIKKAKGLLDQIMADEKRILAKPAPSVALSELADSSVNFTVLSWVNNGDFWGVKCALLEEVKLRFDDQGISIPYPQQDLHLFNETKDLSQD